LWKSFGSGLAQGTISIPGMPGDTREFISHGAQKLTDYIAPGYGSTVGDAVSRQLMQFFPAMRGPTSAELRRAVESMTGPFYEPQTLAGEYARTGGEFVPGAFAPGGLARNAVRYVALPALASETAGQATKGTWLEPWARMIAALGTAGATAIPGHLPRGGGRAGPTYEQTPHPGTAAEIARGTDSLVPTDPHSSSKVSLDGRSAGMHSPPRKPDRPFKADYPSEAHADDSGRLLSDMEGRPLTAEYIAGRRTVGGKDIALTPLEIANLIGDATGGPPREVAHRTLEGASGRYYPARLDQRGRLREPEVRLNRELQDDQKRLVMAHETGHMIDDLAAGPKGMSIRGLEPELENVYSTINSGQEGLRPPKLPQDFGYPRKEVTYELVADAIHAYLTNPNYFKTVAPRAAAAIRALVNSHPQLSKLIQFNSLGGLAVLGAENVGGAPEEKSNY
jgi:hypothetical protein